MTAPLFYVEDVAGSVLRIDGPEGHHAAVVRRLQVGERADVGDGRGSVAECVVAAVERAVVVLDVVGRRSAPVPGPRLVVVQALAKGDRAEDAVEAMTEVGVDEIVPWAAARSIARWDGARCAKAIARWRATAREAGKQSRRPWLPDVSELASTRDVFARLAAASLGVVLHESATTPVAGLSVPPVGDVVVVVGPEGGLTDDELTAFAAAGASSYRLGSSVLRTSTAGVAAAAVLLAASGRWS